METVNIALQRCDPVRFGPLQTGRADGIADWSVIRKSGYRLSEGIMLKQEVRARG
jgi:hypothetical protein